MRSVHPVSYTHLTQEMLYFIRQIKADGLVYGHDGFKVYVDSPLANEATTIFSEHQYDLSLIHIYGKSRRKSVRAEMGGQII